MADPISIKMTEMTLGELEEFERETGVLLTQTRPDNFPIQALTYLAFIWQRRTHPDIAIEDVRNIRMTDIEVDVGAEDESRPPAGAPEVAPIP